MDSKRRLNIIAVVLMAVGFVGLFVSYASQGWTTLGIVGCAALAVGVVAGLVQLRNTGAAHSG